MLLHLYACIAVTSATASQDAARSFERERETIRRFLAPTLEHPLARPNLYLVDLDRRPTHSHTLTSGTLALYFGDLGFFMDPKTGQLTRVSSNLNPPKRPDGFDPERTPRLSLEEAAQVGEALIAPYVKAPWRVRLAPSLRQRPDRYLYVMQFVHAGIRLDALFTEGLEVDAWSGLPLMLSGLPRGTLPRVVADEARPRIDAKRAYDRALAAAASTRPLPGARVVEREWVLSDIPGDRPGKFGYTSYGRPTEAQRQARAERRVRPFYMVILKGNRPGIGEEWQNAYVDGITGEPAALVLFHPSQFNLGGAEPAAPPSPADLTKARTLRLGDAAVRLSRVAPTRSAIRSEPVAAQVELADGRIETVALHRPERAFRHGGRLYGFEGDLKPLAAARHARPLTLAE